MNERKFSLHFGNGFIQSTNNVDIVTGRFPGTCLTDLFKCGLRDAVFDERIQNANTVVGIRILQDVHACVKSMDAMRVYKKMRSAVQ